MLSLSAIFFLNRLNTITSTKRISASVNMHIFLNEHLHWSLNSLTFIFSPLYFTIDELKRKDYIVLIPTKSTDRARTIKLTNKGKKYTQHILRVWGVFLFKYVLLPILVSALALLFGLFNAGML